jgi:hypothetical protein
MNKLILPALGLALSVALTGCMSSSPAEKISTPKSDSSSSAPAPKEEPAAELGTRENPYPLGQTVNVTQLDNPFWDITLGAPDLNAGAAIEATNEYNDPAPAGSQYVMVPITATYVGETSATPWMDIDVSFVAATGETYEEASVVHDMDFYEIADLYTGGTGVGQIPFALPSDKIAGGTWRVTVAYSFEFFYTAQ